MSKNQATRATRKSAFRLFAAGHTPEGVVEEFERQRPQGKRAPMSLARVETLYEEYLALPMGEKLRLTLMTENVSNRLHRLMDDISDLSLVDGLLSESDKKALALLLDIKRKIKERMSKEFTSGGESAPCSPGKEGSVEVNEYYDRVYGEDDPDETQSK